MNHAHHLFDMAENGEIRNLSLCQRTSGMISSIATHEEATCHLEKILKSLLPLVTHLTLGTKLSFWL